MADRVKKVCLRCGRVKRVPVRQRHCYRRKFGVGSYACWGELQIAGKEGPMKERPQALAQKRLGHARKQVAKMTARIKRAVTSQRFWERRAAYYAKRASMTDAEVETERQARLAAKAAKALAKRRRAIEA